MMLTPELLQFLNGLEEEADALGRRAQRQSTRGTLICWLKGMPGYLPPAIQAIWIRRPSAAGISL